MTGVLLNGQLVESKLVIVADGSWSDELLAPARAGLRLVKGPLIVEALANQPADHAGNTHPRCTWCPDQMAKSTLVQQWKRKL